MSMTGRPSTSPTSKLNQAKKKKKNVLTSHSASTSTPIQRPLPAKPKDHVSTLNLRAGERVEMFLNKTPRLGTLKENTTNQYGWQKSRVKVKWDDSTRDTNENNQKNSNDQKRTGSLSAPSENEKFDWADTIALRKPAGSGKKVSVKSKARPEKLKRKNADVLMLLATSASASEPTSISSSPPSSSLKMKTEDEKSIARNVSRPQKPAYDDNPYVPTDAELSEASKPRARDALLNWYRRLEDLRQFRIEHGHSKCF
jgi:hypothetical protein